MNALLLDGGANLYLPLKWYLGALWLHHRQNLANLYNVKIIDGICWGFRQPNICYFGSCLSSALKEKRNQADGA